MDIETVGVSRQLLIHKDGGYALIVNAPPDVNMGRILGDGWRDATRWERFLFALRRPRFSIRSLLIAYLAYSAIMFVVESLT